MELGRIGEDRVAGKSPDHFDRVSAFDGSRALIGRFRRFQSAFVGDRALDRGGANAGAGAAGRRVHIGLEFQFSGGGGGDRAALPDVVDDVAERNPGIADLVGPAGDARLVLHRRDEEGNRRRRDHDHHRHRDQQLDDREAALVLPDVEFRSR